MNVVTHQPGAAGFLRLPGGRLPWLAALRDGAAEAFRAQGFPTRRVEAWKYTDLAPVTHARFDEPLTAVDEAIDLPPARAGARFARSSAAPARPRCGGARRAARRRRGG